MFFLFCWTILQACNFHPSWSIEVKVEESMCGQSTSITRPTPIARLATRSASQWMKRTAWKYVLRLCWPSQNHTYYTFHLHTPCSIVKQPYFPPMFCYTSHLSPPNLYQFSTLVNTTQYFQPQTGYVFLFCYTSQFSSPNLYQLSTLVATIAMSHFK